jgi:hypothetical protein
MRNTVLAKPNLKLFLVAAILIAVLYDLISNGKTQASVFRPSNPRIVAFVTDAELETLIKEVEAHPSAAACARISEAFEKRGNMRQATRYMQMAYYYGELEQEAD